MWRSSDSGERSVAARLGGAQFASEIVAFCTVCGVWVASRLTAPTTLGRIIKEGTPVGVSRQRQGSGEAQLEIQEGYTFSAAARSITSALRFPD